MKNSKKILISVLALAACTACTSHDEIKSTIICGEVINADRSSSRVLTIFPLNFVGTPERYVLDISRSEYKFNQEFVMTHKHDVTILYNGGHYALMAEPSDSIFVTIDAKSRSVVFSGSNARFNNQMMAAIDVVDSKFREVSKFDIDEDVDGIIAQFNDKIETIMGVLDEHCATNSIDDNVRSYLRNNAIFGLSNYVSMYDAKNTYSPERYKLLTHEIFDLDNPDKALSYMYSVHVGNLMPDFLMSDPTLKEEYLKRDKDVDRFTQLLLGYILQSPKSMKRDILLTKGASLIKYFAVSQSKDVADYCDEAFLDADNYFNPRFLELYVRPIFQPKKEVVVQRITGDVDIESKAKYINRDNEVVNLGEVNIIDHIKERYRGRVIYLDVWATWCAPCMREMKYAVDLHKLYEGREDLVFVNLCLSSAANKWVESIAKNDIGGENYFVEGGDSAQLLLSKFNLRGYPSYLLIDKSGNIVTTDAFSPSQINDLATQLDNIL